ncbi:MAG: hypothetical protein WCP52_06940 [Bacteroidota bacterium]
MCAKSNKRVLFKGLGHPHIGKMLKKHVQDNRLFQAVWARKQGVKDETVIDYFKKESMQISTLFTICQVLDYNFFKAIADALPANMPPATDNPLQAELDALKTENEKLKMKIDILEKMLNK